MAAQQKWTEDRTNELVEFVGDESPVSQETVKGAADQLGNSTRSISSKLRKLGFEVEKVSAAPSRFTEDQEAALRDFVVNNSGSYTYADLAEVFEDGAFSARTIQGKVLSMELTEHVKPAAPRESTRTYTGSEEETVRTGAANGDFLEDIAEAVGKSVQSVRGKCLSLLRSGDIASIPKLRNRRDPAESNPLAGVNVEEMTVAEIAEATGKTERGVKSMLTRRGLDATDYKGSEKKAKNADSE